MLSNGTFMSAGTLLTGKAWSTIKVPVVLARYHLADSRNEKWSAIDPYAARAIEDSDNAAAQELFDEIESAKGSVSAASVYVAQELAAAGDSRTHINTVAPTYGDYSTYGQTYWSIARGTTFFRQLARLCVPDPLADRHVLDLMGRITPSQAWGIGTATWTGSTAHYFKGGWGPDPAGNYLVRQFGIIDGPGGAGFVVGLIARPTDGQFGSGEQTLSDLATAVAGIVRVAQTSPSARCGR